MLVLGRKLNETIVIAGNIRITAVAIRGRSVRLSINAPADVPVFREELLSVSAAEFANQPVGNVQRVNADSPVIPFPTNYR